MIYLHIFWTLFLLFCIAYSIGKCFSFDYVKALEDQGGLFFMILGIFAVMAIVTKDPISVAGIEIPMEFQWIGSLLVAGFGAWKFYLNPMKKDVYRLDREIGEMKGEYRGMYNGIKREMEGMKESFRKIEKDMDRMEKNIEKLLDLQLSSS